MLQRKLDLLEVADAAAAQFRAGAPVLDVRPQLGIASLDILRLDS